MRSGQSLHLDVGCKLSIGDLGAWVERLWRSVKDDRVYRTYDSAGRAGIAEFMACYMPIALIAV